MFPWFRTICVYTVYLFSVPTEQQRLATTLWGAKERSVSPAARVGVGGGVVGEALEKTQVGESTKDIPLRGI